MVEDGHHRIHSECGPCYTEHGLREHSSACQLSGDCRGTFWTLLVTFCTVIIRCTETFWSPCTVSTHYVPRIWLPSSFDMYHPPCININISIKIYSLCISGWSTQRETCSYLDYHNTVICRDWCFCWYIWFFFLSFNIVKFHFNEHQNNKISLPQNFCSLPHQSL
jgi:hypothetical protein